MPTHISNKSQITEHGRHIETMRPEDLVKAFEEESDPQTVFYLNPIYPSRQEANADSNGLDLLWKTMYFWAPKIELTVREKLKTSPEQHVTAQASWDRASFRSKLLDNLLKNTPWMAMENAEVDTRDTATLTGEYHHDKALFRNLVNSYLQDGDIPVTDERLNIIPNYVSEAMTLAAGKLQKIQRFAVLLPLAADMGLATRESMRIIVFSFEQGERDPNGGVTLQAIKTEYEAFLNKRLCEEQKFDDESMKAGKVLVQQLTVDVAM